MPLPVVVVGGSAEVARRLQDALKDFEKTKCRVAGRRLRTACKTIAPGDMQAFYAGNTAQYLVSERAADVQAAWGVPVNGDPSSVTAMSGLSYADLAHLHATAMVPVCLDVEAGHHTCHPEEKPGREFYEVSRLLLQEHIRRGRIRWSGLPRGGGAGDILPGTGVHERIDCGPGGLHAGTDACRGIPTGPSGVEAPNAPRGRETGAPGTPGGADPGPNPPIAAGLGAGALIVGVGLVLLLIASRK